MRRRRLLLRWTPRRPRGRLLTTAVLVSPVEDRRLSAQNSVVIQPYWWVPWRIEGWVLRTVLLYSRTGESRGGQTAECSEQCCYTAVLVSPVEDRGLSAQNSVVIQPYWWVPWRIDGWVFRTVLLYSRTGVSNNIPQYFGVYWAAVRAVSVFLSSFDALKLAILLQIVCEEINDWLMDLCNDWWIILRINELIGCRWERRWQWGWCFDEFVLLFTQWPRDWHTEQWDQWRHARYVTYLIHLLMN